MKTLVTAANGLKYSPEVWRLDEDGDLERRCSLCHEWWPATAEYFYKARKARPLKLQAMCKACSCDISNAHHKAKAERLAAAL